MCWKVILFDVSDSWKWEVEKSVQVFVAVKGWEMKRSLGKWLILWSDLTDPLPSRGCSAIVYSLKPPYRVKQRSKSKFCVLEIVWYIVCPLPSALSCGAWAGRTQQMLVAGSSDGPMLAGSSLGSTRPSREQQEMGWRCGFLKHSPEVGHSWPATSVGIHLCVLGPMSVPVVPSRGQCSA